MFRLRSEESPNLIEQATEVCRRTARFEIARGPIALFDSTMRLLKTIVRVTVRPVYHSASEHLPDSTRVGVVAVGGNAVGCHTGHGPRRAEERLSRHEVPGSTQPHVYKVPIPVDGTLEVTPLSLDFDVHFIDMPAPSDGPTALLGSTSLKNGASLGDAGSHGRKPLHSRGVPSVAPCQARSQAPAHDLSRGHQTSPSSPPS